MNNKQQYITTSGSVREALERHLVDDDIFIGSGMYSMVDVKNYISPKSEPLSITNVIFNPPATIVFWSDKTKTVVKCDYTFEDYDPEKGIAMAISKKMLGDNKYEYYNVFKHWLKKWDKQPKPETKSDVNTRNWTGDMSDV